MTKKKTTKKKRFWLIIPIILLIFYLYWLVFVYQIFIASPFDKGCYEETWKLNSQYVYNGVLWINFTQCTICGHVCFDDKPNKIYYFEKENKIRSDLTNGDLVIVTLCNINNKTYVKSVVGV